MGGLKDCVVVFNFFLALYLNQDLEFHVNTLRYFALTLIEFLLLFISSQEETSDPGRISNIFHT